MAADRAGPEAKGYQMQGIDGTQECRDAPAPSPMDMIRAVVAFAYDVKLEDMLAMTRGDPRTALARQIAMYLGNVVCGIRLSAVAAGFARHRSTACHALHRIEDLRDDPEFDRTLRYLESTLRTALGEAA